MKRIKNMMGVMALFLLCAGFTPQNCTQVFDPDSDTVIVWDNCPHTTNSEQSDLDNDGTGDVCEQTHIIEPDADLQIIINNARAGDEFLLQTGTYHLTSIQNKNEIIIRGQGATTRIFVTTNEPFRIENSERIQLENFTLILSAEKDVRQENSDLIMMKNILITSQP